MHSTAFRPIHHSALKKNPFRVFTSLLRIELIENEKLKQEAETILNERNIFTENALILLEKAELQNGLTNNEANAFLEEILETFRWHVEANVTASLYEKLHNSHRLIADVVSFKGPHINHLTPRTLDIDKVQKRMHTKGITAKAVIEGPPKRNCPILLRQTSFKALSETISFKDNTIGAHTARFGEIEQRGIALTPKGRALYDMLLAKTHRKVFPKPDGSNAKEYMALLETNFQEFPDNYEEIRKQDLAYFSYHIADKSSHLNRQTDSFEQLISDQAVTYTPVIYEDFLPVSAAGIFQSNLGDQDRKKVASKSSQKEFESSLGCEVLNEFEHYLKIQQESIKKITDFYSITA